jgi:glutaredoxin 2
MTGKERHNKVINEIHDTYIRKNEDYGNSFEEQFNEYGLLSALIRLDDKMRRLKQLSKQEAKVKDESTRDTVLDLANYAIMTVMELDKNKTKGS